MHSDVLLLDVFIKQVVVCMMNRSHCVCIVQHAVKRVALLTSLDCFLLYLLFNFIYNSLRYMEYVHPILFTGKKEIMELKDKYPAILHSWSTIYTKYLTSVKPQENERKEGSSSCNVNECCKTRVSRAGGRTNVFTQLTCLCRL